MQGLRVYLNPEPVSLNLNTQTLNPILGGSWVGINGVRSRVTVVITRIRGLITPLITTHEPPSKP